MYVRLAFAVAAHLESEILIVDEVLAVGDAEFQKKCLGKMGDVSKGEGRTVLFVSHNIASVQELCNFGLLLDNGKIAESNNINYVINKYLEFSQTSRIQEINVKLEYENKEFWKIGSFLLLEFNGGEEYKDYFMDLVFYDKYGMKIFSFEGAKNNPLLIYHSNLIIKIYNPGLIDNDFILDIGLKKCINEPYTYLGNSILIIRSEKTLIQSAQKGLVLPYFEII
jgi:lipopolysaccharide transport system ATP-binding protein